MLYFFGKAFKAMIGFVKQYVFSCCHKRSGYEQDNKKDTEDDPTYQEALRERQAQSGKSDSAKSPTALSGAETYRLPHHPRYMDIFTHPLYKPIFFKAFGQLCYTTLASSVGLWRLRLPAFPLRYACRTCFACCHGASRQQARSKHHCTHMHSVFCTDVPSWWRLQHRC